MWFLGMGKVLVYSRKLGIICQGWASWSGFSKPKASALPGSLLEMQGLSLHSSPAEPNSGGGPYHSMFSQSLWVIWAAPIQGLGSQTSEECLEDSGARFQRVSFAGDPKCSSGHWGHVTIKWSLRGGHCAEGTQAANSLAESNFLQIKKC